MVRSRKRRQTSKKIRKRKSRNVRRKSRNVRRKSKGRRSQSRRRRVRRFRFSESVQYYLDKADEDITKSYAPGVPYFGAGGPNAGPFRQSMRARLALKLATKAGAAESIQNALVDLILKIQEDLRRR